MNNISDDDMLRREIELIEAVKSAIAMLWPFENSAERRRRAGCI
jgi:hypothetical protein